MIKAILLDIDGTMRDSRAMIYHSYEEIFKHFGLPMPDKSDLAIHMPAGPELCYAHYAPQANTAELVAYYRNILGGLLDNISTYEGVAKTLQKLRDQGIKLGVVSASKYAKSDLASDGLADFMDVVIDGHTPIKPKPDPEGALMALKQLGVEPGDAVMVGDLPADVQLGKAAGLRATVATSHGFGPRPLLEAAKPDYIIDSFPELLAVVSKL